MANDTEARNTGSSAMIIGVVALVLIVGLAAVFFMRGDNDTANDTTVVNPPTSTTVVEQPDVDAPDVTTEAPDVNVEAPDAPATGDTADAETTTTTTTDTETTTN